MDKMEYSQSQAPKCQAKRYNLSINKEKPMTNVTITKAMVDEIVVIDNDTYKYYNPDKSVWVDLFTDGFQVSGQTQPPNGRWCDWTPYVNIKPIRIFNHNSDIVLKVIALLNVGQKVGKDELFYLDGDRQNTIPAIPTGHHPVTIKIPGLALTGVVQPMRWIEPGVQEVGIVVWTIDYYPVF